ncbi:prepilin-type N-terminal cleavage/methylation domain-containing protein [Vibrio ponticus]|uniref:Prepilin-type N-terminal cleavage/methylation domain-containing protein n=2 Tax=Vibrio ponticus TaxID=265668 RepID=A0A3N3DXY6_9VIBR|nr:prepilin-type N-terminal cleavage/methylation domain-containing protein [Vibrio ponticus]
MMARQRGFSLIEVMLCFALTSIAALGLLKLQAMLAQKAVFASQQVEALHIAERQLERYLARAETVSGAVGLIQYSDLALATHCGGHIAELADSPYELDCQLEDVSGVLTGKLSKIIVTVRWARRVNGLVASETHYQLVLVSYVSAFSEF